MYKPRMIENRAENLDSSGIKIYTVSAHNQPVKQEKYLPRLQQVKKARAINWEATPAFAIFHDGLHCEYLVLLWWANDNELFTSVSVKLENEWIEDPEKYSFCLYDLEIMWAERNIFIKTMDCQSPSLKEYQGTRSL